MSLVKANTYQDASGGSNAVFSGVSSPPNSMGFRNRIINGAMMIDQRNAGASVTPANGQYTLDRWFFSVSQTSKLTSQQSTTAPTGFKNSILVTSSSAYTVGASEIFLLRQNIEGNNIADLAWGTASAQSVTLSFWVRSSLTGTFGGAFRNSAANRFYPFSYTISSANTFEYKTVTIAGDTSGTWATDNTSGIELIFSLGAGSTVSGTAGSWGSTAYYSATGATSVVGTNGATFYITGVQLEAGTNASPFERIDYGRQLIQCQRYARRVGGDGTNYGYAGGVFSDGGATFMRYDQNPVEMRSTISITTNLGSYRNTSGGPTTNQWALNDVAAGSRITWGTAPTFIALASNDQRYVNFYSNNGVTPSASVVGRVYEYQFGPTAYIILSSEL